MKQTIHYLTIASTSLIFFGCAPKQLSQSNVIKTTTISTPSLGRAIQSTKTPIKKRKEPVVALTKEPPITKEVVESRPISIKEASIKEETTIDEYGNPPKDYRTSIRKYLAKDVKSYESIKYIFSRPYKVEKNNKTWRGWAVDVDMLKRNGKGKVLRKKPYTILFDGSSIIKNLSDNPKNITKVVY